MTLGKKIREIRKDVGLTQAALGEKIGVSGAMIGQWENDLRNPKLDTIVRIADALDMSIFDFFPEKNDEFSRLIYQEGFEESQDELRDVGYTFSERESVLLSHFGVLNDDGQQKVVDYAGDLVASGKYQRTQDETATKPIDTPLNSKTPPEGE